MVNITLGLDQRSMRLPRTRRRCHRCADDGSRERAAAARRPYRQDEAVDKRVCGEPDDLVTSASMYICMLDRDLYL